MYRFQARAVAIGRADDSAGETPAPRFAAAQLAAAHINPVTGLATDYLNHFNEAIMLLELAASCPDCRDDLKAWRPMSYREHFLKSRFTGRDLAIAAYDAADPAVRDMLETLSGAMTSLIEHTRIALSTEPNERISTGMAERAASWLKLLVAQAGSVINGHHAVTPDGTPQSAVDRLIG